MKEQIILWANNDFSEIDRYLIENDVKRIFLVCGNSIKFLKINDYFEYLEEHLGIQHVRFSDFSPNPTYESVEKGVELFCESECDLIVAVGGGSAMDVAKCIKLFCNMNKEQNFLEQPIVPNEIKLFVVPTTAGTGSEATRFAVIYYKGEKQSVSDWGCIPDAVLMDAETLKFLPEYQRKVTMLDALCHALESFWSVNSTSESKGYAGQAIQKILVYMDAYLRNEEAGNMGMLEAAYIAGKAINITQTTAGHAMAYKLTSLYDIAHGHAAALCVSRLWPYMITNVDKCSDSRGVDYLKSIFDELAGLMKCNNALDAAEMFADLLCKLELTLPNVKENDYMILKRSVNPVRLKNNPIFLDEDAIDELYHQILEIREN